MSLFAHKVMTMQDKGVNRYRLVCCCLEFGSSSIVAWLHLPDNPTRFHTRAKKKGSEEEGKKMLNLLQNKLFVTSFIHFSHHKPLV
jgi:hypothetical protein